MRKELSLIILLAACDIKVDGGGSDGTDKSSDVSKAAPIAQQGACKDDFMVGKEYANFAQTNGMGYRKLNLNDKCEMSVSNCSQTLKFPENYEVKLDVSIHAVVQVEITGVQGWVNCMNTGVKTCDVSLVTFGAQTMFVLNCTGETVQYSGTK